MKRKFFFMLVALLATVAVQAQQISVVAEDGTTNMYRTLQEAIEGAPNGSVIYLPGGGFTIADSVKITKKLTIIGIGHKVKGGNADGNTTIDGNLFFNEGSDGSALMGCYISGNVEIAEQNVDYAVNDITIRLCNVNSIVVRDKDCIGIFVNQNYIRRTAEFGNCAPTITNNVLYTIGKINGGVITHNIVTNHYYLHVIEASNSTISNNVFFNCIGGASNHGFCYGGNNRGSDNLYPNDHNDYAQFDNRIILEGGVSWNDVFVNNAGVTPASNYHFKEAYQQYESLCGIYAGTGFDDSQMPPTPYISSKSIPMETDASGKLHIQVTVNAK